MSDSHPPDTSTEPRGLSLRHLHRTDTQGGTSEVADVGEDFRTQLMWTTVLAMVVVALLAASGAIVVKSEWYSTSLVSVIVAAGSVMVSVVALGRVYSLSRSLRPVPIAVGSVSETSNHRDEPTDVEQTKAGPAAALPPQVASWMDVAEFDSATFGNAPELRQEVFGKLAYRLQSLVNRLIHKIDNVEQEIEDPELLKSLYVIDHLATRIRRQIENLAVLGGEAPQRRSNIPVEVNAMLRAAVAEIEHYTQVTTVPIHDVKIHGRVVAEIIHLLAELLENATTFTTDDAPKVMLRAHRVTAGLAIQVQDRGIGMPIEDITRLNRLLDGSTRVDVGQLLQDGRIGLAVVEILARRHNIAVELQPNIFGGTDASIVIQHSLLSERERGPSRRGALSSSAGQGRAVTAGSSTEGRVPTPSSTPVPSPMPMAAASVTPGVAAQPYDQAQPQNPAHAPSVSQILFPGTPPALPQLEAPALHNGTGEPRDTSAFTRAGNHQQEDEAENPLPALPVRKRGERYAQLRSGTTADSTVVDAGTGPGTGPHVSGAGACDNRHAEQVKHGRHDDPAPADLSDRPALPQRHGSHLREDLRETPALARPIPGHDPTLMSALQEGRARGRVELAQQGGPERDAQQPQQAHDSTTEGDSASWPT